MTRFYCSTRACLGAVVALYAVAAGTGCHSAPPARNGLFAPGQKGVSYAPGDTAQGLPITPDPQLSPGAVLPVTREDICVPGYTQKVRSVPASVKQQVYAEYGIASHKAGDFEVDHLISLELGGSNSPKNLWPESYKTQPWNARVKDALENRLHADVCTNQLDLPTAQHEIATDWVGAYKRVFGTSAPTQQAARRQARARTAAYDAAAPAAPPASGGGQVWVNTKSGKYFGPGSAHYGTTRQGAYMSERQAVSQGYVAARGQ